MLVPGVLCAAPPLTPGPGEDRRPFPSFSAKDLVLCCSVCHHQPHVAIDIQVLKIKYLKLNPFLVTLATF